MTTPKEHSFTDGGVNNVYLKNGFDAIVDPDYGECTSYYAIEALNQQVAVALAFRHGRLRGLEFQFIRKTMGMARRDLSRKFDRTELTITNWEKTNKVPLEASVLLKQLCLTRFGYESRLNVPLDHLGDREFGTAKIVMTFDPRSSSWRSNLHPPAATKVAEQVTNERLEVELSFFAATISHVGIVAQDHPGFGREIWVEPKTCKDTFTQAWEKKYRHLPTPHPIVVTGHK